MLHNTVLYLRTVLNLGPESSNLTSESAFITKLSHSKHDGLTYEKAWKKCNIWLYQRFSILPENLNMQK